MDKIAFRTLRADEIECRPQFLAKDSKDKIKILLYIDSRAVTNLLDETVGNLNWQFFLDGKVGRLCIKHPETGEWITKSDTGSESNIEAEKGLVSDIYKRCLSRWGVNELYTSPSIILPNDGYNCTGYKVSKIAYDENRKITVLEIVNRFGKVMYTMGQGNAENNPIPSDNTGKSNAEMLKDFCSEKKKENGVDINCLKKFFEFYSQKAESWKGNFDINTLFQRWVSRERKAA